MAGRWAAFGLALVVVPACGFGGAVERSPRPETRPDTRQAVVSQASFRPDAGFSAWVAGFRGRALAQGIAPETFERAFAAAGFLPQVIERDRRQAEFTRAIWDYLDSAVSETRVANGRAVLAEHRAVLDRIEARFGVDKEVVVAIWGLESAYGAVRGDTPLIAALATLAYDGRRGAFFEDQLIAALRILQAGDVAPAAMTGSWAGAMGHTQFMPTSYLAYAADYHGDGRRDIWADDPADALASTANYLARFGWQKGQPWGVEVVLPAGFDFAQAGKGTRRAVGDWARAGVRAAGGGALPDHGPASILLPAGARGPALMIFDNFRVISRYNSADSYVIAVGHLADRIGGGGPFRAGWPRGDRALEPDERRALQALLTRAGFDTRGVDGRIGPNTIAAIRAWQRAVGEVPDGYATAATLERLR